MAMQICQRKDASSKSYYMSCFSEKCGLTGMSLDQKISLQKRSSWLLERSSWHLFLIVRQHVFMAPLPYGTLESLFSGPDNTCHTTSLQSACYTHNYSICHNHIPRILVETPLQHRPSCLAKYFSILSNLISLICISCMHTSLLF